jgi:hypothetical protein
MQQTSGCPVYYGSSRWVSIRLSTLVHGEDASAVMHQCPLEDTARLEVLTGSGVT